MINNLRFIVRLEREFVLDDSLGERYIKRRILQYQLPGGQWADVPLFELGEYTE